MRRNLVVKIPLDDILFLLPKSVGVQRDLLQSTRCPQIRNTLKHTLLFDKLPAQHPNSFLYLDGSDHLIVFDIDKVPAQHRSCFFDPPGSDHPMIYGIKSSIVLKFLLSVSVASENLI